MNDKIRELADKFERLSPKAQVTVALAVLQQDENDPQGLARTLLRKAIEQLTFKEMQRQGRGEATRR